MDTSLRILVIAAPGRTRDSLAAILRTLRPAELFLVSADELESFFEACADDRSPGSAFHLAVVDVSGAPAGGEAITRLRARWPEMRILALVDTLRLNNPAAQWANGVLHHGVSTGELLAAVQQLAGARPAWSHAGLMVQTGLSGGRLLDK